MNLSTLNTDAPISVLAVFFWVIAGVALIAGIVATFFPRKPRTKNSYLFDIPLTPAVFVAAALCFSGFSVQGRAEHNAQDVSFRETLSSDYGLTTDETVYSVKTAAENSRSVVMSDERGRISVRPQLDGDTLTFYKLDKGVLINPRT